MTLKLKFEYKWEAEIVLKDILTRLEFGYGTLSKLDIKEIKSMCNIPAVSDIQYGDDMKLYSIKGIPNITKTKKDKYLINIEYNKLF